jgi:hypothetical protein
MATATPSARRGPRRRRSSTPCRSSWTRSHPPPASVLPESAARKVSASVRRACIPNTYAASGPNREPGRILIPGDGAAGDQGLRIGLPAPQWRLRDACGLSRLNDFLALWSQAHLPSCNRQVHIDLCPHGQTRLGEPPSRSRTAINGHIVFGSNNFRSPNICLSSEREQQVSARANCPVLCGTGNERQPGYPGIRVRPWVALSVDVRCSDTVAGRRRDGASKRSRRGAPYCQRRPIF